ncbi:MAG: hypothetical protein KatS3mg115_0500 [Candidatus Poribacteria bacterium]|nr:MAG: hypothetical protein KatS3mg115_0500 [Candidatus Poribacteria bacterium]
MSYDRDYTLILDDLLLSEPAPLRGVGMGRGMGMMGGMMGGRSGPGL